MTNEEKLTECLCECIKIASPSASISSFIKQFFGKDIIERLPDIDPSVAIEVMRWAAKQNKYKTIFVDTKPHHAFCQNYNQIAFNFDQSKKEAETKPKSTACKENNWGRPAHVQALIDETHAYCDRLPTQSDESIAAYWAKKLHKERPDIHPDPDAPRKPKEEKDSK